MKGSALPALEIGYAPRALVFGTLPVRPVAPTTWIRRLGPSEVQVFGAPETGVPFGEDRTIYLLAATRAVYANQREFDLGTAFAILRDLGLPPDGRNYLRLAGRLLRVCNSALFVRQQQRSPDGATSIRTSVLCFDRTRLWCEGDAAEAAARRRMANRATLSEDFWRELRRSFVSFRWEAVRVLAASPANLDFYLWASMRAAGIRPGGVAAVPLVGAAGLMRRLGLVYAQARDFRIRVRRWLVRIQGFDPDFPAELAADGANLMVWYREPAHATQAQRFLREVRAARAAGGSVVPGVAP